MILALQASVLLATFYAGFLAGQTVATKKATETVKGTVIKQKQTIK